ncbi:hypothetical protein [Georgenia thermotolerans]|uniref:DUF998 domain-containing protein n=1 Tax=Georgenia thermotolerans TaxID=527326 RepID=A0A7J5ULA7_9MICO|nr:hypothetical protein [Georgenia thermotolerans]KAE8763155.1 hypothetical protein GB883_15665 [Georgenia thermotolerans]
MTRLTWAALAAAVPVALIALTDAVTHGLTGEFSVFADGGPAWAFYVAGVTHGLLYALLTAVLVVNGSRIDAGRGAVRWVRRVLIALLALLAVSFLLDTAIRFDDAPAWLLGLTTAGFVVGFPVSTVLGILLLRRPEMRLPAVLLTATGGGLALTLLLGAVGSDFAHPGYAEVLQFFGVALLGRAASPAREASPSSARYSFVTGE